MEYANIIYTIHQANSIYLSANVPMLLNNYLIGKKNLAVKNTNYPPMVDLVHY